LGRTARKKSSTGIYHVIVRGVNREPIFYEDEDRFLYLESLAKAKKKAPFLVHAYCLMDNHVHLLLQETTESIGDTLRRIGSSYVYGFNRKYERVGHLFQGRFTSETVENDSYFLTAFRYIHQNPVKAKITQHCAEYEWSSYGVYSNNDCHSKNLVDTTFALDLAGGRQQLLMFINTKNNDKCLDLESVNRLSDVEFITIAKTLLNGEPVSKLTGMHPGERDMILRMLKSIDGASIRQISRLTGLGRWVISNA